MNTKLLISKSLDSRLENIQEIIAKHGLSLNHPDLLYLDQDQKLGVEAARKIRQHLSLKPYMARGRGVVVLSADEFTLEGQNSLLKTLEEPPENSIILLGAKSESSLLSTIKSRSEITFLDGKPKGEEVEKFFIDIEKLGKLSYEQRVEYIESLEQKDLFLKALVSYFRNQLAFQPGVVKLEFAKLLLRAEEWQKANVNIRAILEYLMLNMPRLD